MRHGRVFGIYVKVGPVATWGFVNWLQGLDVKALLPNLGESGFRLKARIRGDLLVGDI